MKFLLGTDEPSWLYRGDPCRYALLISRRRFERLKTWRASHTDWVLDSGGFSELRLYGEWRLPAKSYVEFVRRCRDEIGRLRWAAPQDWMCEPFMVAKTGLSVKRHQQLTVENFIELRSLAPDLPIAPALQGWSSRDYLEHVAMYERAGVDLFVEPIVGMGSFCRRGKFDDLHWLVQELAEAGLRMHGFGVKTSGVRDFGALLESADSLAWTIMSKTAGCPNRHLHRTRRCNHCKDWAQLWADQVTANVGHRRIYRQATSADEHDALQ